MIESIRLTNFQSHRDTHLDFHPGVNVLIGPSDTGKTAIMRALRWVVFNRPLGDAFRSWWSVEQRDPTAVTLKLPGDVVVRRVRSESDNLYEINGEQFIAKEIPPEVSSALNIGEINVQGQMDNVFLLSQSPGEVARYLNRVIDLEQIDTALFNIAKRQRDERAELARWQGARGRLEEDLEAYDWLPEAEGELEQLEAFDRTLVHLKAAIVRGEGLLEDVQSEEHSLSRYRDVDDMDAELAELESAQRTIGEGRDKIDRLQPLLRNVKSYEHSLVRCNKVLAAEDELRELQEMEQGTLDLRRSAQRLEAQIEELRRTREERKEARDRVMRLTREFNDKMPEECPLCGSITSNR